MSKIRLEPDELSVESYPTAEAEPQRGTVQGEEASVVSGCPQCAGTVAYVGSCYNGCTMDAPCAE
ncbi:MAG: hypothetical protein JO306_01870 [Gemmatimonadetes bacterium]|nr:hypothetical protein [Gemmatimonadota bacterium]